MKCVIIFIPEMQPVLFKDSVNHADCKIKYRKMYHYGFFVKVQAALCKGKHFCLKTLVAQVIFFDFLGKQRDVHHFRRFRNILDIVVLEQYGYPVVVDVIHILLYGVNAHQVSGFVRAYAEFPGKPVAYFFYACPVYRRAGYFDLKKVPVYDVG